MSFSEIKIDPDTLQTEDEEFTAAHEFYEAQVNSNPNRIRRKPLNNPKKRFILRKK